jgi:hypothetical protein
MATGRKARTTRSAVFRWEQADRGRDLDSSEFNLREKFGNHAFQRQRRGLVVNRVFLVQHVHVIDDGTEDVKVIGVYSTTKEAENAVMRAMTRSGFKTAPDGFHIDEYVLDKDEWTEGYFTIPS